MKAEPARIMKNGQGDVATHMAKTGKGEIQKGAREEEEEEGVAICTSMPTSNL